MGKRHRKKKTYVPYVNSRAPEKWWYEGLCGKMIIVYVKMQYTNGLKERLGKDLLRMVTAYVETPFWCSTGEYYALGTRCAPSKVTETPFRLAATEPLILFEKSDYDYSMDNDSDSDWEQ